MKLLTCVCLPDKVSEEKLRRIRDEVSSMCGSKAALAFPPHLSLRNDFKINDADLSKLSLVLQDIASNTSPLHLMLSDYGFYPWKIVFLKVRKTDALQRLHEEVMEAVQEYRTDWVPEYLRSSKHFEGKQLEYIEKYGYQFAFEYYSPHFTIAGADITDEDFRDIQSKLGGAREDMKIAVDRLVLLDREDNSILREFKLSG
jgi:2'-5' RNA ligase